MDKKINMLRKAQQDSIKRLQKDVAMQYLAVFHTFNSTAVNSFIEKVKERRNTKEEEEELNLIISALKYSGGKDFSSIDQLMESVKECFNGVGKLLEEEIKVNGQRSQQLERHANKYRVGRVYFDKK